MLVTYIKQNLKLHKKSTISLNELYKLVSDNTSISINDLYTTEMEFFRQTIDRLIDEEVISKRGKKTDCRGFNPLHLSYNNLLKEKKQTLSDEDKLFLYALNKDIDVTYYFKNVNQLKKDKDKLQILSNFMDSINDNTSYMGINERSYELFGYEKELLNNKNGLLIRAKVDLDILKCFVQYSPIQCYILRKFYSKDSRKIVIVENLNTYLSLLRASSKTILGDLIDMIIYGGGNTISGNFKQHIMYDITDKDSIYYFGDIDPEGLSIYKRLKDANNNLNIQLCNPLYKLAIDIGKSKGIHEIHNENQSLPSISAIEDLLSSLDEDVANDFKNIILSGKYIPQEAVNYDVLINAINNLHTL